MIGAVDPLTPNWLTFLFLVALVLFVCAAINNPKFLPRVRAKINLGWLALAVVAFVSFWQAWSTT